MDADVRVRGKLAPLDESERLGDVRGRASLEERQGLRKAGAGAPDVSGLEHDPHHVVEGDLEHRVVAVVLVAVVLVAVVLVEVTIVEVPTAGVVHENLRIHVAGLVGR